jgi:dystroglycan 1
MLLLVSPMNSLFLVLVFFCTQIVNESASSAQQSTTVQSSTTPETTQPSTTTTTTTTPSTTTQSTTTTTEAIYVEPANTPPMIKNRLPKQPVTAGKPFSLHVDEDTFYDHEDGTDLVLEMFDKNEHALKPSSWIQFNAEKREIYGL